MIRFTIFFILILWNIAAIGQEYQMDGTVNLINDCEGFFTDSGGSSEDYGNNQNFSTTICKNPRLGTHIRLTFSQIDLAPGDKLCFYDGLGPDSDSLVCIQSFHNGFPFIVQATAANSSGCLALTFNSNSSGVANGWEANIDCIPSCQLIQADIATTNPISTPAERGWIDICHGERVFFNGNGNYPQNNLVYTHSDQTSTFEWDFGDGTYAVGNNVSHVFEEPGGYRVTLTIKDQFGCTNGNFVFQRVRVATRPDFTIGDLPEVVCLGDSIVLSGSVDGDNTSSTIEISPQEGSFIFNGVRSDSLALPDGNGASYKTGIRFTDFAAGQVLTDINDLQSICVNMEHSWLHDMEISITCPSGKKVILQNQEIINKEVYLGIPEDNDGINPTAGIGLKYCWTPSSDNGTMTQFVDNDDNGSPNDTYYLPSENYESFQDLETLLGCPLNGDWIITVTDLWEQDNGWIFSWSIDINPDLYPDLEKFETEIIDFAWENSPDIISYSAESIIAQPTSAGQANYIFEASDNYGCQHDTSIQIKVLPNNHPDCLNCEDFLLQQDSVAICKGDALQLQPFIDPYALGVVTFRNFPEKEFSNETNPPENAYINSLQISNVPDQEINAESSNLISVCINLESEYNSDLSITLVSPNGVHIDLSSENGGKNDGYLNTCFTTTANRSINDPIDEPFSGNYLPEESFTKLVGSDINGVWELRLSDDAATDVNTIKSWSMTFLSPSDAEFVWSPADGLSCTECTNPTASPEETTTYILEKNFEGCQVFDTLIIHVLGDDFPINIQDFSLANGELLVSWDAIPNVTSFEVSRNSVDWIPANGNLHHIFDGLQQNENFDIYVRGIYKDFNCKTKFRSRAVIYKFCDVTANLGSNQPITSCAYVDDAFVVVVPSGGTGLYTYTLNDSLFSTNNRFEDLSAGEYFILVEDNQSCADTITFSVTSPPPITLNFDKNDLDCFGDDDGMATVLPTGGVGGFQVIAWERTGSTESTISNLNAGFYQVTVEDANNCIAIDTVEIISPTELQAIASESPVSCFGKGDGEAAVKVTDGTKPYSFEWNDGQTGPSAINLDIGNYTVIVQDANNCTVERTVTVTQPDDLAINFTEEPISCPGEADGAILAEVEGGIQPYEYNWSTGQTNQFTFGLIADRYFLTVTDGRGCAEEEIVFVNNPNPLAISTMFTPTLCEDQNNGSATVNVIGGATPYNYEWNDDNNQTTATAIDLSPGEYEVTITDGNECVAQQTVTVEPSAPLTISFIERASTCANRSDGMAVVNVTGGSGNFTFLWENGETSDTLRDLLPGKYPVTIFDENACQKIDTAEIIGPAAIAVDSIAQVMPTCNGAATGTLQAYISGGVIPYNYSWDNDQSTNQIFENVPAGMHTLSLEDANGCSILPVTVSLEEPPAMIISTSQEPVKCFGGNDGMAMVNPTGGLPPYTYLWNDEAGQTTAAALNLSAGRIQVIVTDNNGCSSQEEVLITQPPTRINTQFIQTDTSCFKANQNQAMVFATGGTGTNYTYEWSSGSTTNTDFNLNASQYKVSVFDENNCETVDSIIIQELDSIAFSIIEVKPKCSDSRDGQLAISPIEGGAGNGILTNYRINWSADPNANQEVISDLLGNTSYEVTVTDQMGCFQIMERFLEAPPPIILSLNKIDISCNGANDGHLSIGEFSSTAPVETYDWNGNVPDGTTDLATNLSPGAYELTVTDSDGCSASARDSIIQSNPLSISSVQMIPNICQEESQGQIFITVEGGDNNYTYNWSNGTDGQNLINVESGKYYVNIQDGNNCELMDSFNLIDPVALTGETQAMPISCFGANDGRININSSGGLPPYVYSTDGINYNGIENIIGLEPGNHTVYIKDQLNCIWESGPIELIEPEPFNVSILSESKEINLGDTLELVASFANNNGAIQYSWSANTPNTFDCDQGLCSSIEVVPPISTTYEIYAVDANDCESSDLINILVSKTRTILVPTGFSPDGNGQNDILMVHGEEGTEILSFQIFDRWGEEVYSTNELNINDPKNGWDGTFKGSDLNTGVYVWLLEVRFLDGRIEVYKGSTTLLR